MENVSTLAGGASGALVQRLQLGLRRAGEDPGPLDGEYGAATARAVAAFQRRQGLAADGRAGRDTQQALTPWYRGLRGGAADLVPCEIAWSAALTEDCVLGLAARHPLARLEVFGKSVLGRRLYVLRLGRGRRRVLYSGGHHANEWITVPVLLEFAQALARAWEEDGEIGGVSARALLERSTVYIAPLINPDGTDLVTGCLKEGPVLARARALAASWPELPFPSGWKANLRGVDLNLQYPAGWEAARRRKAAAGFSRPAPRDYPGTAPLSQPESRALALLTRALDPALVLAYHAQGAVLYRDWRGYSPPGSRSLGRRMAEKSGYALEEAPAASGDAGYKDWFIREFRRPGYTVECGLGENPLPLSQLPAIQAENRGILVTAAMG